MLCVSSSVDAPGARGRQRGLGAGVAAADDDDVETAAGTSSVDTVGTQSRISVQCRDSTADAMLGDRRLICFTWDNPVQRRIVQRDRSVSQCELWSHSCQCST